MTFRKLSSSLRMPRSAAVALASLLPGAVLPGLLLPSNAWAQQAYSIDTEFIRPSFGADRSVVAAPPL